VDEMQGSVAFGAQPVIQMDRRQFLKPDSALVRTALDLLATHVTDGAGGESASCGLCGLHFPCPPVRNARQVVNAGGVLRVPDRQVDRVPDLDRVPDRVVEPASAGPVEPVSGITLPDTPDVAAEPVPDTAVETADQSASRDPVGAA
jgi:hypothetical protein